MPGPLAAAAVVGEVVGALNQATGAVKGFIDSVAGFVQAVDPSAVRVMNDALRSLTATIGYALQPVIVGFTQFVKDLAGELFEPMTALRDVVGDLVSDLLGMLRPLLSAFGDLMRQGVENLRSFMPAVKAVAAVFVGVANVVGYLVRVWQVLVGAVLEAINPWAQLPDLAEMIGRAFVRAVVAIMRFTDYVLRAVGLGALANKLLEGGAAGARQGRAPAYENVQLGDTQSVYRAKLLEAARATGGGAMAKQPVDYMAEIAATAKDLLKKAQQSGDANAGFFKWLQNLFGGNKTPEPFPRRNVEENPRRGQPARQPELGGPEVI